jgi:hypothetical protein
VKLIAYCGEASLKDEEGEDIAEDPKVTEAAIFQVPFLIISLIFPPLACKYALDPEREVVLEELSEHFVPTEGIVLTVFIHSHLQYWCVRKTINITENWRINGVMASPMRNCEMAIFRLNFS